MGEMRSGGGKAHGRHPEYEGGGKKKTNWKK